MAVVRKITPYLEEQILAEYAMTKSMVHCADKYKVSEKQVSDVIKRRRDDFLEIREEMKLQMVKEIWGNMAKAQMLGTKMLQEALSGEREIPLNHISTYFGTMYDKQALMTGENTQNIGGEGIQVVFNMPDVAEDEKSWKDGIVEEYSQK